MSQTHLPRAGCVSAHPYITNHTEVLSKVKKKIIATLCAALMLSGVITGCSGSASSGSQAAASTGTSANTASGAEGKTTLNVLWWGSQTRHEMTTEMLEKFEELNPDIDVVMDYSDWDGYWTKLPAQVAGGQTPDVFQMDYAKLAEYVENGVTADLSSYIADGSLDMSNVEQNILDSGPIDGKVYAISTGTNAPALLYRQDILDELGLSLPMNPTMSEYAEVSKAVYEATGLRDTFITLPTVDNLLQLDFLFIRDKYGCGMPIGDRHTQALGGDAGRGSVYNFSVLHMSPNFQRLVFRFSFFSTNKRNHVVKAFRPSFKGFSSAGNGLIRASQHLSDIQIH